MKISELTLAEKLNCIRDLANNISVVHKEELTLKETDQVRKIWLMAYQLRREGYEQKVADLEGMDQHSALNRLHAVYIDNSNLD
jgi:hypothetical protein